MRWGRRAPPVPAAAGVNLLRSPAPGGGGGREGEGGRAAGGSAGGGRTRQRTGPARNRREPPRAGGGAAGAPPRRTAQGPPRGECRAAPPVWALARQGGGRDRRDRPGAARERPRRGRGQATADPRQRRGLPMRPTLFAPAQTPGGGEHGAGGARSGGRGGGSRRKAGPQLRPPDAPPARSTVPWGRAPAQKESAQAIKARTLSQVTRGQPLAGLSYHSGAAAVKPPEGAASLT